MKHKSCQSHCCEKHGCKYGHEDCPVVLGEVEQDHPCEACHDEPTVVYVVYATRGDYDASFSERNVKAFGSKERAEKFTARAQALLDALKPGEEGHKLDADAHPGETYSIQTLEFDQ